MKHALLLCWCTVWLPLFAVAQGEDVKENLHPCGTSGVDPWLIRYLNRTVAPPESGDTLWAGIQIHLLARDDGSGRLTPDRLLDAFHRLNEDFSQTGIRFFFKHPWNLINRTFWFQHDSIVHGREMMFANNVSGALNVYFMARAAGNCGYNLPYAGIAMAHACSGANDHTWAHEVGHALALPHPFLGWEGKVYDPNQPTPDTLLYDYTHFHSMPDTIVPAPLDTALVEYADGSNCAIAADRICDTGPDYLSYRWNCNAQGQSTVEQRDPAGTPFFSDGTLFMSYAADNCQRRFTVQQIQIMRARLLTDRSEWLAPTAPANSILQAPQLVAPINSAPSPVNATVLQWKAVPEATHYLIQVSKVGGYGIRDFEVVVTDTFVLAQNLTPNWNYFWRVRPFNAAYVGAYSPSGRFLSVPSTAVRAHEPDGWRVFPTLLSPGVPVRIEVPPSWQGSPLVISVFDATGRLLFREECRFSREPQEILLPTDGWASGAYYLVCSGGPAPLRQSLLLVKP